MNGGYAYAYENCNFDKAFFLKSFVIIKLSCTYFQGDTLYDCLYKNQAFLKPSS